MALVAMLIVVLLFRRSGQKFNWSYCFAYPIFATLVKAIELEWSIPPLTMSLAIAVPLALFILIAIVRRRRRPG